MILSYIGSTNYVVRCSVCTFVNELLRQTVGLVCVHVGVVCMARPDAMQGCQSMM